MTQARASVRDGLLTYGDGELEHSLVVGSPAWGHWLEQPDATAFRVEDGVAPYSARRQVQRGRWYWYAYRRQAGRLHKYYLGRSSDVTIERLAAIAARFAADCTEAARTDGRALAAQASLPSPRNNLPDQLSSFLGRQAETAEVRRLLDSSRLVTLTGTGGMGKTRLALHVAADIVQVTALPVWLVELAPLAEPALVPQAVARPAGIREVAGQPLLTTLAAGFGAGPTLLVLDNCEHLVEACARLAEHLLRACPDLRLLATSREPLGVPGEIVWRVPALQLPDPGGAAPPDGTPVAAVGLFVERAQVASPGFALSERNASAIAALCRRLDGIPLAIELAASQARLVAPEELSARLDDRLLTLTGGSRTAPPRQRTLQATIDWSYELLSEPERRCFAWLTVFAGGFTLDAAEGVCGGDGVERNGVWDLLSRLIDCSLVQVEPAAEGGETRYRLLDVLRAYGAARLTERAETDPAQAQHAAWFTDRAEEAARAFHGPDQGHWLRWAECEHDNIGAALTWAVARNDTEVATRLASAIAWSWLVHQRWSEGLDWAVRALALPIPAPTRERGRLLVQAIQLMAFRGDLTSNRPAANIDLDTTRLWVEECLAIGEALDDVYLRSAGRGLRELLRELGIRFDGIPELDREEELAELRQSGNRWGVRRSLEAKSRDALRHGDLDLAGTHLEHVIALAREDGDSWSLAVGLNQLGDIDRARGRHSRAKPLYEESAAIFTELGLGEQPNLLHNLGYVALAMGDRAGAAAHFTTALAQFRRLGEHRGTAECLLGLGTLAIAERRLAAAGRLFGAGEAALAALGAQLWPANRPDYERWLARARASRAVADFNRTRAESRALPPDQTITWVQDEGGFTTLTSPPRAPGALLTPREQAVAQLAANGLSNREIAMELAIAEKTAANHVQRVLEKLDVRTRAQLAARAAELGIRTTELPVPSS